MQGQATDRKMGLETEGTIKHAQSMAMSKSVVPLHSTTVVKDWSFQSPTSLTIIISDKKQKRVQERVSSLSAVHSSVRRRTEYGLVINTEARF